MNRTRGPMRGAAPNQTPGNTCPAVCEQCVGSSTSLKVIRKKGCQIYGKDAPSDFMNLFGLQSISRLITIGREFIVRSVNLIFLFRFTLWWNLRLWSHSCWMFHSGYTKR